MGNRATLWRRELAACFLSPVAYATLIVFLAACNGTFCVAVLRNVGRPEPLTPLLIASIVLWLPVLITVIAMRLFAEEKRSGALEMLMTAPVTEAEVVLGKYAGALTFATLILMPAIASIFVLARLSPGITVADVDPGALAAGALIVFLLAAFFLAIGLVASLTTRNQIVSAIVCFAAICLALFLGWLISMLPGMPRGLADCLSATDHVEDFSMGLVDVRPVVLYVTATMFLLFVAVHLLEARRWK